MYEARVLTSGARDQTSVTTVGTRARSARSSRRLKGSHIPRVRSAHPRKGPRRPRESSRHPLNGPRRPWEGARHPRKGSRHLRGDSQDRSSPDPARPITFGRGGGSPIIRPPGTPSAAMSSRGDCVPRGGAVRVVVMSCVSRFTAIASRSSGGCWRPGGLDVPCGVRSARRHTQVSTRDAGPMTPLSLGAGLFAWSRLLGWRSRASVPPSTSGIFSTA